MIVRSSVSTLCQRIQRSYKMCKKVVVYFGLPSRFRSPTPIFAEDARKENKVVVKPAPTIEEKGNVTPYQGMYTRKKKTCFDMCQPPVFRSD